MFESITILQGPTIGESMVFIMFDLVAFLVTLMLLLRIGSGELSKPVFMFSISFLLPALLPLFFGVEILWLVPLIQSIFSLIAIYWLMRILGVFDLITGKK